MQHCQRVRVPLTAACAQICCITFAYMAGQYADYGGPGSACPPAAFSSGPESLWKWLIHWDGCHIFNADFLVQWGAW